MRNKFYPSFPELTDKTLDAVASFVYRERKNDAMRRSLRLVSPSLMNRIDPTLHEKIEDKIEEHKWTYLV